MLLLVLLFSSICGLVVWFLRPEILDSAYFPMGIGYRWVYAQAEVLDGQQGYDVVFEVTGTQEVGGTECYVVKRTIDEHHVNFFVEVNRRGVFLHQVGDDRYEPPYCEFAFGKSAGASWSWRGTIGGEPADYECGLLASDSRWLTENYQQIEVPLRGKNLFSVSQETSEYPSAGKDTQFFLAEGIGVVCLKSKDRDKHDPPHSEGEPWQFNWQLKEFTKP